MNTGTSDKPKDLEARVRCLHQVFRPSRKNPTNPKGYGECYDCEYDYENNKKCKGYTPITVTTYLVKDDD